MDLAIVETPKVEPENRAIEFEREEVLDDYRVAVESRELSQLSWNEVFSGKAKFGIFGDGKEVPQVAMARYFRNGDFRSGYYRDQTFMLASGMLTIEHYMAQLYAHTSIEHEPASGGRCMNGHFATRTLDENGDWIPMLAQPNCSADVSPTGSQMPRLVGLAYASKLYRQLDGLQGLTTFSHNGDEVAWGTIGNASCAEGMFWEAMNAIGVLQAPMLMSIWDDAYGISVPNHVQIARDDLSKLLSGFQRSGPGDTGIELMTVPGWNYPELRRTYARAEQIARRDHVPVVVHAIELTQPLGHSTSGSHERYKTPERLKWEKENDCLLHMRQWLLDSGYADESELQRIEKAAKLRVQQARDGAWAAYQAPILEELAQFQHHVDAIVGTSPQRSDEVDKVVQKLSRLKTPLRRDMAIAGHELLLAVREEPTPERSALVSWLDAHDRQTRDHYGTLLYSESRHSPLHVEAIPATYPEKPKMVPGSDVVNACFKANMERMPELIAFGEDVGKLGDVNKGMTGLQDMFGELRVTDTGIREATIMGQAIGMAMRGLRPLAEIQYLDYLLYGLQILSDDTATVQFRTRGGQKAPMIVRTRGHRLEGVWHSGSPMGAVVNLLRGMWICVPRDMTQAAGMYNTLLRGDDPALVVEVLNGYRLKEALPENVADFTVPLGIPEVLRTGTDVTLVTYGACCRIALAAADTLSELGIEVEIIDIQTLLPFDRHASILDSVKKTNRVLFVDEDVPGGATAYMMRHVVETQGGFHWLDSEPRTLPAAQHRPPYGSDGDYYAKPNVQTIFEVVYEMMHETAPGRFPLFFRPQGQA